jgi:FkbM family methyltransferase
VSGHSWVLHSVDDLRRGARVALYGAGETGQAFLAHLRSERPDVTVECFLDSYRTGMCAELPIRDGADIPALASDVEIVICSVFWSEVAGFIETQHRRSYRVLSNRLVNDTGHLASYGSFYFEAADPQIGRRLDRVSEKMRTDSDRELLQRTFDLRMNRREEEFLEFAARRVCDQRTMFGPGGEWSAHLQLEMVEHAIDGGVYEGESLFRLLRCLKQSRRFKKVHAFDPNPAAFRTGPYADRIDPALYDLHRALLWDREELLHVSIDRAHPANSKAIDGESAQDPHRGDLCAAVTVDAFLSKRSVPVDLITLDVEGAEMKVLAGARDSISRWRPQIAVSLYHVKEHLLDIPEFLSTLHDDYRFSVFLHTATFIDMTLYAS